MILCASVLSNKSLMEEATKCLFRTSLRSAHSTRMCFTVSGHWQVPHSGKSSPERSFQNPSKEAVQFFGHLVIFHSKWTREVPPISRLYGISQNSCCFVQYFHIFIGVFLHIICQTDCSVSWCLDAYPVWLIDTLCLVKLHIRNFAFYHVPQLSAITVWFLHIIGYLNADVCCLQGRHGWHAAF